VLRNKFEKRIHRQLKRAKAVFTYETEKIPYVIASHYIPDFIVQTALGKIYVECKGYLRPEDKRKLIAVKKQHPAKDIRLLFYAENKKQIKWAERIGFRWAIEKIPLEWMKGL
jgi:predicted nuclease of restriction endonuclease-like RecB superfamily